MIDRLQELKEIIGKVDPIHNNVKISRNIGPYRAKKIRIGKFIDEKG